MSGGTRDPWFDNAKFALLALVVAGHVVETWIRTTPTALVVYNAIYLFHMPAIILLSGAFAGRAGPTTAWKQALRFALLYIVFQVAFQPIYQLLSGVPVRIDLVIPVFALWFLPALSVWSLIAPLFARHGWLVAVALLVAICVGFLPSIGAPFSLSRILVFLPFLALGAWLGPSRLAKLKSVPLTAAGSGLVGAVVLFLVTVPHELAAALLLQREGYATLGVDGAGAAALRLWALSLGLIAALCFLALVPARPLSISPRGQRTLQLYILHSAAIISARMTGILPPTASLAALAVGAGLWAGSLWFFSDRRLGQPPVARLFDPFSGNASRRFGPRDDR